MRNKWKMIVMCLVMAAVVLLEPVSYVRADEGTYSEEVPYMKGISVDLIRFDLNPFNYILAELEKFNNEVDNHFNEFEKAKKIWQGIKESLKAE